MKTVNKTLVISYIILTIFFVVEVILSFYDHSYSGYYTDKIINWSWLLLTVIIIICFWKKKPVKIYFYSLLLFILLSILPMAIPFLGMLNFFSTIDDYQQIGLNNNYRIERTNHQALSIHRIYIYKKRGIIEENIGRPIYSNVVKEVLNLNMDDILYEFEFKEYPIQNAKLVDVTKDSIGIEYQIKNKKKLIYHPLQNEDGY